MECPFTLADVLSKRALEQPNNLAYAFIAGAELRHQWSYSELYERAASVGEYLRSVGPAGSRALLVYPQGLEFLAAFLGCISENIVAVPVPAPEAWNLGRSIPRLKAIAQDAQANLVLTTTKIEALWAETPNLSWDFKSIPWVSTDALASHKYAGLGRRAIDQSIPAYLQYTSGSTSTPSGVVIRHSNLMHHFETLHLACGYGDGVTVTWMPHFHDYGLVQGLLQPLYSGDPCYFMSPLSFLKRPAHWLAAISKYRATHSQAPNFAYGHCIRRIRVDELGMIDLGSWKAAGNAAEPINPQVLDEFVEKFRDCGFRRESFAPAYGLAEATLLVSSRQNAGPQIVELDAESMERGRVATAQTGRTTRRLVSCGELVGDTDVSIVDPNNNNECRADEVGEIWVASRAVAAGYWNNNEKTQETFEARLSDGRGPWLRTGDLGFIQDGSLFVCGRLKDIIIIRGTNYAAHEIEWIAQQSHPLLGYGDGAAFSLIISGEERLMVFQELSRKDIPSEVSPLEIAAKIRESIAQEFDIRAYAVALGRKGATPKTSSGKIQRGACRLALLNGSIEPLFVLSEGPLPQVAGATP